MCDSYALPALKDGAFDPPLDRRRVWRGTADRTKGGLTRKELTENKHGKIVRWHLVNRESEVIPLSFHISSKKQSAQAKKKWKNSGLSKWTAAVQKARAEMGITGFMVC